MSLPTRRPRSRFAAVLTVLTAVFVVLAAAPASAAGYSQMQNKERPWGGTICLEIDNGKYYAGAAATVEWCSQYSQHENWHMLPVNDGSGYVQLQVAHTGQCLTVRGGSYADSAQIEQRSCTGAQHQQWKFVPATWDGVQYYEVVARHSGKCLDKVWTWNVVQYNCHAGDNQLWTRPAFA